MDMKPQIQLNVTYPLFPLWPLFAPKHSISTLMSSVRSRKPPLKGRESKEAQEQARSRTERAHSETPGGKQATLEVASGERRLETAGC